MAENLVIVESPTKAKTISKMLGPKYKVVATVGHLRDLPKSKMGVDIENDFEPQYINVRGRAPKINELKKQAKSAKKIYLATDPDREGEAISWHLSYLLGLDINNKNRVEFNEITKDFVKESLKNPRSIDMDLVNAQQARRVLDRIVGYKLSPILWKKIKNGLSAGRVQSVALKLICDREKEIEAFVPQEYWSIEAFHEKEGLEFKSEYFASLLSGKEKKATRIKNEKEATEILNSIDKDNFKIVDISKKKRRKNPFMPFTTSTLQQESNKKLNFSTSKTMSVAQQLYEGIDIGKDGNVGLISYMRTDSTRLSQLIVDEAKSHIIKKYGKEYHNGGKTYDKKKSGSQDAHEAVRPSSISREPAQLKKYLTREQYLLYELIWNRTVASQMKQAVYEVTTIKINSNDMLFKTGGNIMKFDGFMRLWMTDEKQKELPELEVDEVLKTLKIDKIQHFTKPKPRFTEASLVKALEEDGIGRPSTYSSIIRNILNRNYVELEKKQFVPTQIGINVNELLAKYFSDIVNEEFTAQMEKNLDDIVDNKADWKKIIADFYSGFEPFLDKALKDSADYKIEDVVLDEKCPECGKNLVEKNGRNGKFIGCSGFPDCKFTKSIVISTGVECPKCGHDIVEKVSKRGRLFFGCSNYPACKYASWNKPTGERCPKCDDLLTRKKNRYGDFIVCNNPNCDFEKENTESVTKK
ncbi:MAG: type I DNA topoisomerase [Tissierellia bacterium]|nr:type I DNA topoisomerase [Tissierellia bacterium]